MSLEQILMRGLQSQVDPAILSKQRRNQALLTGGASIFDAISGGVGQRNAESDIDMLGAEGDSIREQMRNLKAPGAFSPETQAAAVRNATILGGVGNNQDDSSELAAAKMAIDAGGDPANIQRALTEANERKDSAERQQQQGAFNQGLGYAHSDANQRYQQEMQNLGMDYDDNQSALNFAQNESLNAQNQKQKGFGNLINSTGQFFGSGGMDQIKGLFGSGGGSNAQMSYGGNGDVGDFLSDLKGLPAADGSISLESGGVVQKTPGAFKHDDGDGMYEEGENEMILMAQQAGGLVDTGIRQTGGEFVINPTQAKGMEKAYDRAKKKKNPSKADLMALFEAVRFLDEPQFD